MKSLSKSLALVASLAVLCALAAADPLLTVSGPAGEIAAGLGVGDGQQGAYIAFSTSNPLTNVSIALPLSQLYSSETVDVWLTDATNPGANVLDSTSFSVAVNTSDPSDYIFANYTAFTGLALGPGSYDVFLDTSGENDVGIEQVFFSETSFAAPGVKYLASYGTNQQSGSFAPDFTGWGRVEGSFPFGGDLGIDMTGTDVLPPSPAPEPAPLVLLLGGLGVLAAAGWERRRRAARSTAP